MPNRTKFTAPGLSNNEGAAAAEVLQDRLGALTDLQLTLKHVHWNVVGPNFIAVHKMLDPQVKSVRKMVDETAERIATLGMSPNGTLGGLAQERDPHDDYPLGREDTMNHLEALDQVYDRVISQHRQAMHKLEDIDLVSQDMIIQQLADLEQFQWFVRAHREDPSGKLTSPNGSSASSRGSSIDDEGMLEESGGPARGKNRK
jgi:starvation-inducible DNA-binding protein